MQNRENDKFKELRKFEATEQPCYAIFNMKLET